MANWIYGVPIVIIGFLMFMVPMNYMKALYTPRLPEWVYPILAAGFAFLQLFFAVRFVAIKPFFILIDYMIIGVFLFDGATLWKRLGSVLLMLTYVLMIDAFSGPLYLMLGGQDVSVTHINERTFFCSIYDSIWLIVLYRPVLALFKREKNQFSATFEQNFFMVVLGIVEVIPLNFLYFKIGFNASGVQYVGVLAIGFILFDAYLIYIFNSMSQKYRLEEEVQLQKQQRIMEMRYYENMESQYEHSRTLIHDMKNHMQSLEALYKNGDVGLAQAYTQRTLDEMERKNSLMHCSNRVLAIVLSAKQVQCKEKGIPLDAAVEDLPLTFLEPFDITTIFSNLLDNAIEACESLSPENPPWITLKLTHHGDMVLIQVANPIESVPQKVRGHFVSKKEGEHMGIGLLNVEKTVRKHQGTMDFDLKDNTFKVEILFSMLEEEA